MLNPKYREAYPGKHKVKNSGGKYLTTWSGYNLDLIQGPYGTLSATNTRGYEGDQVTLLATANNKYRLTGYSALSAGLEGDTLTFQKSDCSAKALFEKYIFDLKLQQTNGGTITGSPLTGQSGTTVPLTYTPSADYYFNGWSTTGGTITNNTFKFGASDATAKANFTFFGPSITSWREVNNTSAYTIHPARWSMVKKYVLPNSLSNYVVGIHYKVHLAGNLYTSSNLTFYQEGYNCEWNDTSWQVEGHLSGDVLGNYLSYGMNDMNYMPVYRPWLLKEGTLRTTNALSGCQVFISNYGTATVYSYPKNNWRNYWDVKYLIKQKSNNTSTSYNPDRSTEVSGYVNNTFVFSGLVGWQMMNISALYAGAGFFRVDNGYMSAAPGSAKQTIGVYNYNEINNAYNWLMAQS